MNMSIEIKINKDVGSYEAKFIGPFTKRQDICIALAAPVCWWIYFGLAPVISKAVPSVLASSLLVSSVSHFCPFTRQ